MTTQRYREGWGVARGNPTLAGGAAWPAAPPEQHSDDIQGLYLASDNTGQHTASNDTGPYLAADSTGPYLASDSTGPHVASDSTGTDMNIDGPAGRSDQSLTGPAGTRESMPTGDDALSTGERAGRLLRELLTGTPEYRRMWESRVRRASAQEPSFAAVARVIAEYLWNAGIVAEEDQELDRALKDRVSRALGGGRISAQTMEWFIEAFGMREHEAGLWAAFAGLTDPGVEAGSGSRRGAPALILPQRHRTLALFERYRFDHTGSLVEQHTHQVISAQEDGVAVYPWVLRSDATESTVLVGGEPGSQHAYSSRLTLTEVGLDRTLGRGARHSLELRARFPSGQPVQEIRRAVRAKTESVDLAIAFDPAQLPRDPRWTVWSTHEGGLIVDDEPVVLSENNTLHRFLPAIHHAVVGFRWSW
ncbi:hypothetical protein [Pseudofrankia inefficax]|uniref:hypothetical protein n=1 Tax=Pseudofrankia inefficax (strain DSM 45817 / CECT 9037 / DDB 130130 / EuI1c) TaxID=298654 RepID=UPI0018DFCA51|nr:hypothetical protein [Pseudofrankia inefficax]